MYEEELNISNFSTATKFYYLQRQEHLTMGHKNVSSLQDHETCESIRLTTK